MMVDWMAENKILPGNDTLPCVPGNDTDRCRTSSPGLPVGLTFFFLLLVIVVGVIVYKFHSKFRSVLQFRTRRSHKKDCSDATQVESSHYTSMIREQVEAQPPIYENLKSQTSNRPAANQMGSSGYSEEDLYLQCDFSDDAIYSNDPQCHPTIHTDAQEDDVYVVPTS